ncbi:sigma-70 family RNA polymerase sigma factor [bacterium]|nr:sigma-70 family RNA polymerase sigma factor [candidate division CSSED10-310 bacterium]
MREQIIQLFSQQRGRLLGFIRSRLHNLEDAEDVFQDVFVQVLCNPNAFALLDNAVAWFLTVASNKITDVYRRRNRRIAWKTIFEAQGGEEECECKETHTPESVMLMMEQEDLLEQALKSLPEEQEKIIRMNVFEGLPFKAISSILGVPVNTLIARKRYGIIAIKKFLSTTFERTVSNDSD